MKTRFFSAILMFCLVHFTQPLFAQLSIGGYLKGFAYPNLNAPHSFDRLGTRLQLTFSRSYGERAALFAALDFNYDVNESRNAAWQFRGSGLSIYPVEAYLDLYFSWMDIRLGKQFIFWGTTDWINPTDNINPWDYLNISSEIEDYRIPIWAARANVYWGAWTLELVWAPEFQPHQISDPPNIIIQTSPPPLQADNAQVGARISSQLWNVNYSLSYFKGFDKWPTYVPVVSIDLYPPGLLKEYLPITYVGADFVTTFGKWAFKGEGAYALTQDRDGTDPNIRNPQLQYVLGIDFYATDRLTLNGQFVQTRRFKYNRLQEVASAQMMGRDPRSIPYGVENSASARLQWTPMDFFTVQLITVYNFRNRDYFLLPILHYQLTDGVAIYGGATFFEGPEYSIFGQSKPYSRAFVEVKYSF